MTINEMKERKRELGYSNEKLSELTGVPVTTLQKIFSGTTKSPRRDTILALESALAPVGYKLPPLSQDTLRDNAITYSSDPSQKKQGEYTLEDYYTWPDDQRIELIDGVIYDINAPMPVHQLIAGEVHYQITDFIRNNGGSCIPFVSPIDVQLDRDEKTMVQPDVIIVCNPDDLVTKKNIFGAPDFVLEVISPGTKRKDYTTKLAKYQNAGVREYWIVDPEKSMIFVYFFESETCCPGIYPINTDVPVNIYNGELVISLNKIASWLEKFSES